MHNQSYSHVWYVGFSRRLYLIKSGHIQVKSGSDLDYYLGQWVIQVSDADPVSTLVPTLLSTQNGQLLLHLRSAMPC